MKSMREQVVAVVDDDTRVLESLEDLLEAAGDQDDGQLGAGSVRQPLESEAVDRRHADVRDEAVDLAEGRVLE